MRSTVVGYQRLHHVRYRKRACGFPRYGEPRVR
jgi:hypothetical protein